MKIIVTEIEYDSDDLSGLPETLTIEVPDEDNVSQFIGDKISDITGFCHFGFSTKADPTPDEFEEFFNAWGQSHEEICSCLGYDEDTSDDLLIDDYFWVESKGLWCNKSPDGSEFDELIVELLRFN